MSFSGVVVETAMNVTFPTLMKEFHVETSTVQWITTGYLLILAINKASDFGWISVPVLLLLAAGCVALVLFCKVSYRAASPLIRHHNRDHGVLPAACDFRRTDALLLAGHLLQSEKAEGMMPPALNV